MVRHGRILIVDNLETWREELVEILLRSDYHAESASTIKEALERLNDSFYHIVVTDIRMREIDKSNTDGMGLLDELEESGLNLATKVIMLSAYGTQEQMREAYIEHRVADFLTKEEFSEQTFLKSIKQAFSKNVTINLLLEILFQAGTSLEQTVLNLDISGTKVEQGTSLQAQMAIELEDLLCRLFYHTNGILVRPLTTGHSGAGVLRIQPFYSNKGIGREVIVKFGDVRKIQQEYDNFKQYVGPFVGGGRYTDILDIARTTHLCGIIYTFLGTSSDQLMDFAEFYKNASITEITNALDRLFLETCGPWYANHKRQLLDLTADYRRSFGYTPEQLEQIRSKQLRSVKGKKRLRFTSMKLERTFTNPLGVLAGSPLACTTYTCSTHGDFNPLNLLVDNTGYIWLIDFQETRSSHILRDVAMLDSAIRFQLLPEGDATLEERHYLEELLLDTIKSFSDIEQQASSISIGNHKLEQAYAIVRHLRSLAYRLVVQNHHLMAKNQEDDIREYYIALFYSALNTLQFSSLSLIQLEHALLSASLLADKLGLESK